MNIKWLIGIGIAIGIAGAGFSVYHMNMNMTLLSIIGVFTLTNAMRGQAFKDRGLVREAKWMNRVSLSFAGLFAIVFVVTVLL
ncbi:hypothetical protein [Sporosarcina ureilytica]|uniref:Aspartyl/asparaginyl-tRNA synthetase n=1 Tax=Sporosarcina ureilytica TaxID=298596 RepID=A0A1D8JD83_9BACL|nr:hypothetical protein [Sporosarcina ureilytica]AOV06656.1 hypothetical protein BI350_02890 [Sporosarcina ureilytica]